MDCFTETIDFVAPGELLDYLAGLKTFFVDF